MQEPKPCPFCDVNLELKHRMCRATPDMPVMTYYRHPRNGCIMGGTEIGPDEMETWNRRTGNEQ